VHQLRVIVGSECFNKLDDVFMTANLEDADFAQNFACGLVVEDLGESLDGEGFASPSVVKLSHEAVTSRARQAGVVLNVGRIQEPVVSMDEAGTELLFEFGKETLYLQPANKIGLAQHWRVRLEEVRIWAAHGCLATCLHKLLTGSRGEGSARAAHHGWQKFPKKIVQLKTDAAEVVLVVVGAGRTGQSSAFQNEPAGKEDIQCTIMSLPFLTVVEPVQFEPLEKSCFGAHDC
jgi:hypothetical protein